MANDLLHIYLVLNFMPIFSLLFLSMKCFPKFNLTPNGLQFFVTLHKTIGKHISKKNIRTFPTFFIIFCFENYINYKVLIIKKI